MRPQRAQLEERQAGGGGGVVGNDCLDGCVGRPDLRFVVLQLLNGVVLGGFPVVLKE
ncbi:hypothetical protein [Streptomyces milbemycinicus]|uniref:hypothetical protein n=1 Tax=Streptomyces milbemycinicus TaxID=476552 RepID=UPI003401E18A